MAEIPYEQTPVRDARRLAYSLRRAHLRRPLASDLEELEALSELHFDSVEEAKAAIGSYHAKADRREKIDRLCEQLKHTQIAEFLAKHLPASSQFRIDLVELTAAVQLEEERYQELEEFLEDLGKAGFEAAWKKQQKVESGGLGWHIFQGASSALEALVLLLMLNACSPGFEVLTVSCLAFVYATIGFSIHSVARHQTSTLSALGGDLARIRFLVRDRVINRALVNSQMDEAAKAIRRNEIGYRISVVRTLIIQAIAGVAIIRTVF